MTTSTTKQRPIADFRMGSVNAAVWRYANDNGNIRYTIKCNRSYKDRNGNWQDTSVFDYDDLPVLEKLVARAQPTIAQMQDQDRQAAAEVSEPVQEGVAA